jgi:class 3 adenylate cyclase/pimeloyl-ACP methyl ester carboxylesterase
MGAPETRYARSADVMIAYQVVGDGPFDVVLTPGTVSHVELYWHIAGISALLRGIAEHARLIFFDKRGTGLSDRVAGAPTLEERSDDIRAVMDAAGSRRAVLFGASEGVPMSVVFAASHPERVSALVLYGGKARELWAPDYLFGSTDREHRQLNEEGFEKFLTSEGVEELVRSGIPSADASEVEAWAHVFRYGASPSSFEALDRMNMAIDVREVLPVVSAPTLVVHQRADPWVPVDHARHLADHIPGATFAELDGNEHLPSVAFVPRLLSEVLPFLLEVLRREAAPEPDSLLATVLFSDIVGSTALAVELGDARWRELLGEHHSCVRRQLSRFRGVEIDTAGDGFFARFDGPARAIRCAQAIRDAVEEIGLQVRLGLHSGECQILDGKVAGIAVAIGARVSARAAAGEVLVSQTVKDLVAGSGIGFDERGLADLKGVPGQWRVYAVTSS